MAEPQDITRSPNLLVTLLTWAEAGGVVEPSSGRKATGEIPNDLYTSNEHNWLGREPMRWLRALFARYLSSSEGLVSSWFVDKNTGIWSDDAVGILEGFLSDGPAGTASLVVDLWLDPNDVGGVRVQVNVAKAAPATFLANRDTYIFVPIDLIVPPTVSEPELTFLDVPIDDPPPATPAGTVLVWRVQTDGAGIANQEIFLPDFPVLKKVGFEELLAATLMLSGDLDVGGSVEIAAAVQAALATFANLIIENVPTLTVGVDVTGAGDAEAVTVDGGADTAISLTASGAEPTLVVANTGTGRAELITSVDAAATVKIENTGTGPGALVDSAGAGATVTVENTGTGSGGSIMNDDATSPALVVANNGVGPGLQVDSDIVLAAAKELTLTGDAAVVGGLPAAVTAGTIDTIDGTGVVKPGIVSFYTQPGAPPTTDGEMAWDSLNKLTIGGSGGAARFISIPIEEFLPGPVNTAAGIADTGLEITITLDINDVIYIELDFESRNTAAANDINVQITIDAVITGGSEPYRPVVANRVVAVRRVVKFTAPALAAYTIKGRHGAGAGTTTSLNLRLLVRQANDFA